MHCTLTSKAQESFVQQMTARMEQVAQALSAYAQAEPRSLAELEQVVLEQMKGLGRALVEGVCSLYVPSYPASEVECACGKTASYQRRRSATSQTLLGPVRVRRPYYLCRHCQQGHCPLDQQLGFCAGGRSAGLEELLALVGAQLPFAESVALIAKLSLVHVCPNACREATETLGRLVDEAEAQEVSQAWASPPLLPAPTTTPAQLYVSMDGTTVHIEEEGWRELRLGAVYTTRSTHAKQRPEQVEIRTEQASFYTDFDEVQRFGQHLWLEAQRRGVSQAQEVIVIGDGAHWIWQLAAEHFPHATQILDWYHATEYIWNCAHALYGDGTDLAKQWAKHQLDALWDGQLQTVLARLAPEAPKHKACREAISYFTNNRARMAYPTYRAKGYQVGSGTIESGCKHVITARLDQAGMRWSLDGARFVAKVRARLKSQRWDETIALRPPPKRSYLRRVA